jgi:hypothetical protein
MRKLALAAGLVVVGALMLTATIALADRGRGGGAFHAKLNGYQEVPSKSTIARGTFRARIVGGDTIHYTLQYANAETAAFQAHIHFAQRHTNGGISAFLCGGGDKDPCPPTSGTVTGIIDPTDVIGPGPGASPPGDQGIEPGSMAELIRAMRAGATYANVHTARFGGGEIRGQIRSGDDD